MNKSSMKCHTLLSVYYDILNKIPKIKKKYVGFTMHHILHVFMWSAIVSKLPSIQVFDSQIVDSFKYINRYIIVFVKGRH